MNLSNEVLGYPPPPISEKQNKFGIYIFSFGFVLCGDTLVTLYDEHVLKVLLYIIFQ